MSRIKKDVILLKWLLVCFLIGLGSGTLSALFLFLLARVTLIREHHRWLLFIMPIAGMLVTASYVYFGKNSNKGNNLIIEQAQDSREVEKVPFRLAPLVLVGTLTSHLVGASVGREGTAVQMGGAVAGLMPRWFDFSEKERTLLFICGISAGFSSVFGTPLAGALFAIEVAELSTLNYPALIPSIVTAYWANAVATFLGATHTSYEIGGIPAFSGKLLVCLVVLGLIFGLVGRLFTTMLASVKWGWKKLIPNEILRTGAGGLLVLVVVFLSQTTRYTGLSLELLADAFSGQTLPFDFINKLILTVLSLGGGFQGGEVTPLFEIGATLGSGFAQVTQLPSGFLAALGFIAVFAGASNAPLASFVMGIELFGPKGAGYMLLICLISYAVSSKRGIYTSQDTTKGKFRYLA